jgi:hydrogenase-4 component F
MFPLFFSKLSILAGLGSYSLPLLFLVLLFVLIVAASFALFIIRTCCQVTEGESVKQFRAPWSMKLPIGILLVLIVALGVFVPQGLSVMLNNIVTSLGF